MEAGHNQAKESAISDTERNERHPREGARSLGEHSVRACLHGLADQIADRLEHAKEFGGKVLRIFKRAERAAQDESTQTYGRILLAENPEEDSASEPAVEISASHEEDRTAEMSLKSILDGRIIDIESYQEHKKNEVKEFLKVYSGVTLSGEAAQ